MEKTLIEQSAFSSHHPLLGLLLGGLGGLERAVDLSVDGAHCMHTLIALQRFLIKVPKWSIQVKEGFINLRLY